METKTAERDCQAESEDMKERAGNQKVAGILDSVFDGVSNVIDSLFGRKVAMARSGVGGAAGNGDAAETKECPYCAETVKNAAVKCRYCGSDISDVASD